MTVSDLRRLYDLLKEFQPGPGSPAIREALGLVAREIVDHQQDRERGIEEGVAMGREIHPPSGE